MSNKMLIDATHPEETRVVVLRGNRVEEFDHESLNRRQLRGNIYLAKVTRVEPSLQAAFVDFGGNRHGFLAFSEIHPDYYQIPVADRQALLEEEAEEASRAEAEEAAGDEQETSAVAKESETSTTEISSDENDGDVDDNTHATDESAAQDSDDEPSLALKSEHESPHVTGDFPDSEGNVEGEEEDEEEEKSAPATASEPEHSALDENQENTDSQETPNQDLEARSDATQSENDDSEAPSHSEAEAGNETEVNEESIQASQADAGAQNDQREDEQNGDNSDDDVESVGSEDILEEVPHRIRRRRRTYKIQEVIKRRQIILVQVVKEERGNKGAALTTYLSLAGRYTVLMPNTARGGGISRKITNHTDRRRLRKIANELEVPGGMGLIIRTAGASRTRAEIKRDFEYLLRLWENVRDLTLESTAPSLVYEEGSLIKRSIRDLYSKEIDEVLVAGEDAYREAKDFMRMLMPSHAKNVQPYKEPDPLFVRHRIERQLNSMFSPYVTLRSGGYIVINQTEALVSVDVNSGKATKEHSIEETALKTNLEAAEEIARQLRLRDLAGLIVIDFIDMDEKRNNRAVERKVKECLRNDRARIQIGRISHFGLMEMSRQRLRTGVLEGSTVQCPHCLGTGTIRSTESVALSILRALEDALLTGPVTDLSVKASIEVALYILNQKRPYLKDIEARYQTDIAIRADENMLGADFAMERINRSDSDKGETSTVVQMNWSHHEPHTEGATNTAREGDRKRARKRRGRGRGRTSNDPATTETASDELSGEAADTTAEGANKNNREGGNRRGRKRGRRGGRRHRASRDAALSQSSESLEQSESTSAEQTASPGSDASTVQPRDYEAEKAQSTPEDANSDGLPPADAAHGAGEDAVPEKPKPRRRTSRRPAEKAKPPKDAISPEPSSETLPESPSKNGTNGSHKHEPEAASEKAEEKTLVSSEPPAKPRRGWWQRKDS